MKESGSKSLPEPSEAAKKRSFLLQERIRNSCESGWMPFSDYMNIALYEPELGYYSGGLQKFGAKGDFITSPEVSPLFGQCLANQISEVIGSLKQKTTESCYVIEFGAGSGLLAVDILLQLDKLASLPEKYFILELSAELKLRQKETLRDKAPHLLELVEWLVCLPEKITNAIIVANEVLDAMPVECFKVNSEKIESLMMGLEDGQLISRYMPAGTAVTRKIAEMQKRSEFTYPDGYCSEYNPAVYPWLSAIEQMIENAVILLIDYGYNELEYFHPDRSNGTLMCYYQHRAHDDFLWWPGLQDVTAFVNFTDVAYSATDLGMGVSGYTTQAAFLLANGLPELHESQVTDEVQQQVRLSQQVKTLTLPSEMGDRFKVMALAKNYHEPLKGFSMLDLRNRL